MTDVQMLPLAVIHVHNVYLPGKSVWDTWGDVGDMEAGDTQSPEAYYDGLRQHMAAGGQIPPIEVGFNVSLLPDDPRIFVFNGHHRLAIAAELGWEHIGVCDSDVEGVRPLSWGAGG